MVLAIVHRIGADRTHVVDARGDGANRVIISLLHRMQIDEEVDAVIADVEGRGTVIILHPVHVGNVLCTGVFDLETGGEHIGDNDIVDVGAEGSFKGDLDDHEVVLLKRIPGERAAETIKEAFTYLEDNCLLL